MFYNIVYENCCKRGYIKIIKYSPEVSTLHLREINDLQIASSVSAKIIDLDENNLRINDKKKIFLSE
jgi:hypothetical protein